MNMDIIKQKRQVHFSFLIPKDHDIFKDLEDEDGNRLANIKNDYKLDFENATLNLYKGVEGFLVVIPLKEKENNEGKVAVIYYSKTNEVKSVKIITLSVEDDSNFSLTISNEDETATVTGIFKDGDHVDTKFLNENKAQTEGWVDCVQKGFEGLPFIMKAVCSGACAAVFSGIGVAACAGCIAGLGIDC